MRSLPGTQRYRSAEGISYSIQQKHFSRIVALTASFISSTLLIPTTSAQKLHRHRMQGDQNPPVDALQGRSAQRLPLNSPFLLSLPAPLPFSSVPIFSAPAYYLRRGSGSGAKSWLFHLPGGGWCTRTEDCVARSKTSLGSTTLWPAPTSPSFTAQVRRLCGVIYRRKALHASSRCFQQQRWCL